MKLTKSIGCGLLLLILLATALAPLAVIWALNTLFGLAIAFTLKTWAAALVLIACVGASNSSN